MGPSPRCLSSLHCEIAIIQAKNVEFKSYGNLFVRYYLSAGNNQRIKLNSREISSKSNLYWNESFSLECLGAEESINNLKQQSVAFELRWRNPNPIFGKIGGSQLLGRVQIPWKTVMESPNMEMEKWVMMVSNKSCVPDGVKPPYVRIAMNIRIPTMADMEKKKEKKRNGGLNKWDECGCCKGSGCKCEDDYHIFALTAALEAL